MTDERAENDCLAAELALGLLRGGELRAAKSRESSDPAFARHSARWRGRFAPLIDEVDDVPAPGSVWKRIESTLGTSDNGNVVALRRKLMIWRGGTAAMAALAASLALMISTHPTPPAPIRAAASQPMFAVIKAGQDIAAVANWDRASRRLAVSELKMPLVRGRDYQLWIIPADGKPRSAGVMPAKPHILVTVDASLSAMLNQGATLAVSLEPLGGSPIDVPTGPVVASGALTVA